MIACCQKELSIPTTPPVVIDWSDFNGRSCSDTGSPGSVITTIFTANATSVNMTGNSTVENNDSLGCSTTAAVNDGVDVKVTYTLQISQSGADPDATFTIGTSPFSGDYLSIDLFGMGNGVFNFNGDFTVLSTQLTISIGAGATTFLIGTGTFSYTLFLTITEL